MNHKPTKPIFVPMLVIGQGVKDISFYTRAFDALELRRWSNADGSIHVAELSVNDAVFRLQEEKSNAGRMTAAACEGVTATIAIQVDDADTLMALALLAGAREISPMQDYEYGYRQGKVVDPFGHHWLIEKVLQDK